jgi:hypothetical protein
VASIAKDIFDKFKSEGLHVKLIQIMLKHSVRTTKKTQHLYITEINWLILFMGIIPRCSDNNIKTQIKM